MDIRFRCDASARLIAAAAMLSVAVRGAHADAREDDAIASRLYNEGRVLAEQGRWPDACAKFEASQRRDPALGTSLSLARCYETIGKLDGAWQSYRKAAELAGRAGNLVRRDFAQARAEALELRLANVAIEIPDLPASGLRDSQRAPAATELTDEVSARAAAASGGHLTRNRITLALGAAGLVTAAIGLEFGGAASVEYRRARALCVAGPRCAPLHSDRRGELLRDARSDAMVSTALVIAGGAAAVASAILFVTRPRPRTGDSARIVPVTHTGGAGLALSGWF
jgi:tetratricopeptide (TPR) repeat protein